METLLWEPGGEHDKKEYCDISCCLLFWLWVRIDLVWFLHVCMSCMSCMSLMVISGHRFPLIPPDNTRGFLIRSWRSQKFFKIGVLKDFAIFTEKHLCSSLFLMKLHRCFPVKIGKILKTPFWQKTSDGCFCVMFLGGIERGY